MSKPEIISRKEAIAKSLKTYFTGVPCKNGHLAPKNVNSRQCCECHRLSEAQSRAAKKVAA